VTGNDRVIKYTFGDYGGLNSQNCLSKQIRNELESNLSFITEPYAWLMGQAFKYMLKTTPYFNGLLEEYLRELKIDFDLPIVGYKLYSSTLLLSSYFLIEDFIFPVKAFT